MLPFSLKVTVNFSIQNLPRNLMVKLLERRQLSDYLIIKIKNCAR